MSTGTSYTGQFGSAVQLDINPKLDGSATTVTWWLLTGPWHPLWQQFVVSVISLAPVEGAAEAKLHFPGATHELLVVALNPGEPPAIHTPEALSEGGLPAGGFLRPIDVVHQFTATDDEMTVLAGLCARACVDGVLNPSTDDARSLLREEWLSACVKTLAHLRGEAHAK